MVIFDPSSGETLCPDYYEFAPEASSARVLAAKVIQQAIRDVRDSAKPHGNKWLARDVRCWIRRVGSHRPNRPGYEDRFAFPFVCQAIDRDEREMLDLFVEVFRAAGLEL